MKKRSAFIIILFYTLFICSGFAQTSIKVSAKDFKPLIGIWHGTLTYLDYSSNKPYTMPADITIEQVGKTNKFIFSNIYPDEPKANSADTITINISGEMLNEEIVKSKRKLVDGNTQIITEYLSVDGNDNKPALIRHTYTVGKSIFTKRKDVQFVGQNEWIKRHEYSYTK